MKKYKILFIISPLLFMACGGEYTNGKRTIPSGTENDTGNPAVVSEAKTFADVHTALKSQCLSCHGNNGGFTLESTAGALPEAEAYNNIMVFITGASTAANSQLLQKATGSVSHGGGAVFNNTSYYYDLIATWIEAGTPFDQTGFDVGTPLVTERPGYDIPTASAQNFTLNHKGGFAPVQGKACISCHNAEEGKDIVRFGGTLFSYIHTPNTKYYQDLSSYTVNIAGDNGSNFTATTRSSGSSIGHNNFYLLTGNGNFTSGEMFTAYVKDSNGLVVNKSGDNTHSSSTHRDCNRCHTEQGLNSAPGRVLVPLAN